MSNLIPLRDKSSLNIEWIQNMLTKFLGKELKINSFEIEPYDSKKSGFLSDFAFVTVSFLDQHISLAVKFLPSDINVINFVKDGNLHGKECLFIKAFQKVQQIYQFELPIPKIYYCEYSKDSFTLVMKNLKKEGYETSIKAEGLDTNHTEIAFRVMAQLHVAGYLYLNQCSSEEKKLLAISPEEDKIFKSTCIQYMREGFDILIQEYDPNSTIFVHMNKLLLEKDLVKYVTKPSDSIIPHTLVHGDYWGGQIMVNKENKDFKVIDWQLADVSSPAIDLTSFLMMSSSKEAFCDNLDFLLSAYHEEFQTLSKKYNLNVTFSINELKKLVHQSWAYGLMNTIATYDNFVKEKKMTKERISDVLNYCISLNVI